mmetsp:Transcript_23424/g.88954  ORF Transcript_23424/g.88954 Transcript_23424/m.88954 type:complete len:235 (-) Transcript_23424:2262-2966(-)
MPRLERLVDAKRSAALALSMAESRPPDAFREEPTALAATSAAPRTLCWSPTASDTCALSWKDDEDEVFVCCASSASTHRWPSGSDSMACSSADAAAKTAGEDALLATDSADDPTPRRWPDFPGCTAALREGAAPASSRLAVWSRLARAISAADCASAERTASNSSGRNHDDGIPDRIICHLTRTTRAGAAPSASGGSSPADGMAVGEGVGEGTRVGAAEAEGVDDGVGEGEGGR